MITSSRVRSQRPAATGDTSHFSPHFGVQSTYRRLPTSHPHPFLSTGIFSDTIRTPKLRRNRATLLLESPSLSSQPSTPATLNKSPLPIYSSQDPRQLLLFLASSRLVCFLSTIPIASVDCLQLSARLITLRL
ncbi:Serine--tRNA ligase, cytoplasmic [Fusarium oxysporum f. sp. albedinis]|nr:Serine--tRNA ligase, cytoplasmic [Fusarium oxysporum f. sp. albedinis]